MKKPLVLLLFLALSLGCENGHKLTFEPLALEGDDCTDCPSITIQIPRALGETRLATSVNISLKEEVISLLSFDDEEEIKEMEQAITSFTQSFKELKSRFPDETVGWEAKINCGVAYEDDSILTLVLNAYTFTGGAHGYSSTTFLNFDKGKGKEMENWELFKDLEGFKNLTETKFRMQEEIPEEGNINITGFMFDGDAFQLAENMGYTDEGIQLVYNQYEIASYADGSKILTLPFTEANKYLKSPVAN